MKNGEWYVLLIPLHIQVFYRTQNESVNKSVLWQKV